MGRSEAGFKVIFDPDAQKELKRIPAKTRQRIWVKDVRKLRGDLEGRYRLRVGEYRVVYRVIKEQQLVIVEAIGTRGEVY